jgi:O-antigen/teichoic acid export membrane protein
MRVRLRLATLVTVALAAGGAALLGPFVLTLIFGPDVTLGSFAMALVATGCALAVTNLVLAVSSLAQGRSSSVARCWLGSLLAAGIAYVALTGLPLEDTVIWSFLAAEAMAFALLSVVEARAPGHAPGVSRRSGAGLGRGQEDG